MPVTEYKTFTIKIIGFGLFKLHCGLVLLLLEYELIGFDSWFLCFYNAYLIIILVFWAYLWCSYSVVSEEKTKQMEEWIGELITVLMRSLQWKT